MNSTKGKYFKFITEKKKKFILSWDKKYQLTIKTRNSSILYEINVCLM